jgi:hypothetical protein
MPQLGAASSSSNQSASTAATTQTGQPITVGNGGATERMSIQGLSLTSSINSSINADITLSWTGTLTITGDGINGTYTTTINRNNLDNGGYLTINLPLGAKSFTLQIVYNNNQTYQGTATGTIAAGVNSIPIVLNQVSTGTGTITATIMENVSISVIDTKTSIAVPNAQIQFTQAQL